MTRVETLEGFIRGAAWELIHGCGGHDLVVQRDAWIQEYRVLVGGNGVREGTTAAPSSASGARAMMLPCIGCNGAGRVSTTVASCGGYVKGAPDAPAAVESCRSCHGSGRIRQRFPIAAEAGAA